MSESVKVLNEIKDECIVLNIKMSMLINMKMFEIGIVDKEYCEKYLELMSKSLWKRGRILNV